jgi:hypothetical protein
MKTLRYIQYLQFLTTAYFAYPLEIAQVLEPLKNLCYTDIGYGWELSRPAQIKTLIIANSILITDKLILYPFRAGSA